MKNWFLPVLALLAVAGCSQTPTGSSPARTLSAQSISQPTLLASYAVTVPAGSTTQPRVQGLKYQPWGAPGGLGLLSIPADITGASFQYSNWLTLTLNRPARLTIPGAQLPWMTDWTATTGGYAKDFPAGVVVLGPPSGRVYPSVTLAEAGGAASPTPITPAGQAVPTPNAACPAWVHSQYTSTGPDGLSYATWHPQIDPVYWCSFGHEHGSKPSDAVSPVYNYTATQHGMLEPHAGFKTATVEDGAALWTITQHFGTSGVGRACTRFHTVDVVYSVATVVKADLHFMGDFGNGEVVNNGTATPITSCDPADTAARTTVGPDGKLLTTGTRHLNLYPSGGYEPWRLSADRLAFGLGIKGLSFDTGDSRTSCNDTACTALTVKTGNFGADHRLVMNTRLFLKATAGASGVFYTDAEGETLVSAGTPMSMKQYIEPGLDVLGPVVTSPSTTCSTADAWVGLLRCGGTLLSPVKVLEDGLLNGN